MTVKGLLTDADSMELTMWMAFLSAKAERDEAESKKRQYDRDFED